MYKFQSVIFLVIVSLTAKCQISYIQFGLPKNIDNVYEYNKFVLKDSIRWACEIDISYPFKEINSNSFNIYKYITENQKSGKIKSYIENFKNQKLFEEIKYKEIDTLKEKPLSYSIGFKEVFYFENHLLKNRVIIAGIEKKVILDNGFYIGNSITAYSQFNNYDHNFNQKDSLILIGKTYTDLNLDSLENRIGIKKTYGKNLTQNLWYDLANGYNKLYDLKNHKVIDKTNVLSYPISDNFISSENDKNQNKIENNLAKSADARIYFDKVGIEQDWYYNMTKDIFIAKIIGIDIFTNTYTKENNYKVEKRFKIIYPD